MVFSCIIFFFCRCSLIEKNIFILQQLYALESWPYVILNNVIFFSEENQVFLDPLFVLSNFLLLRWKLRKMMTLFQRDSVVTLQLYLHYSSFILQWLLLLAILFKQIGMAPYMSLKFIDNHRFMTFQKFITLLIFFELAYFT